MLCLGTVGSEGPGSRGWEGNKQWNLLILLIFQSLREKKPAHRNLVLFGEAPVPSPPLWGQTDPSVAAGVYVPTLYAVTCPAAGEQLPPSLSPSWESQGSQAPEVNAEQMEPFFLILLKEAEQFKMACLQPGGGVTVVLT